MLTGDAPVFEVLHPGGVGLGPARGMEGHATILDGLERGLLQLVDGNEPLLGEPGLQRVVAAVAMHDGVVVILNVVQQAVLLEPRQNGLAALFAGHAGELAVALDHHRVLVEDVDLRQVVGLAHSVVVGVMRRGDLDKAGTKAGVHVPIGEDGDLAVDDGQHDGLANKGLFLGVLGADGNTRVAQHGLGTSGGDNDVILAVDGLGQRVAKVPQVAVLLLVLGLVIGDGGGTAGTPVDDALAAVDQAVVVPVAEHLAHGLGVVLVHPSPGPLNLLGWGLILSAALSSLGKIWPP